MVKRCVLIGLVLLLLAGFTGIVGCGGEGGAAGQAAIRYFEEPDLDVPIESVDVLSVEMTDEDQAVVEVYVEYDYYIVDYEGMSITKLGGNYFTVFLEKYDDEWEVVLVRLSE